MISEPCHAALFQGVQKVIAECLALFGGRIDKRKIESCHFDNGC